MSDFLEVCTPGDRRAYVEASDIKRVLTAEKSDAETPGSNDRPVQLVFRDGQTLDVIGKSPLEILTWMHLRAKDVGRSVGVTFLDAGLGDV